MGKIYLGQTSFTLYLACGEDISDAANSGIVLIKYLKPGTTTSESWIASVSDATNGIIYYEVQESDLDTEGEWTVWTHITFSDGTFAVGESATFYVYEEGE